MIITISVQLVRCLNGTHAGQIWIESRSRQTVQGAAALQEQSCNRHRVDSELHQITAYRPRPGINTAANCANNLGMVCIAHYVSVRPPTRGHNDERDGLVA